MNTDIEKKDSPPLNIYEGLTYHILTVISAFTALVPRNLTIWLGKGLGVLIYVLIPLRKKVAIQNLNIAFPEKKQSEIMGILKSCYRHFGIVLMDVLRSPLLSLKNLDHFVHYDKAQIELLKKSQRGIVVSAHLGNWEWLLPFLGLKGIPFTAVALTQKNRGAQKYFMESRQQTGSRIILKGAPGRDMINIILNGGFLGLASDQNAGKRGIKSAFFEKEISIPKGAAVFQLKTGVPLFLCYCILNDTNKYDISIKQLDLSNLPESKEEKIVEIMQRISWDLERKVQQNPHQYFWFHRKWSKRLYKA